MTGTVMVAIGARAEDLLERLSNVRRGGAIVFADCPAGTSRHDLTLLALPGRPDGPITARCTADCLPEAVVAALAGRAIDVPAPTTEQGPVDPAAGEVEPLLKLPQAARALNLHPRTVRARIRDGSLAGSFLGGRWRIRPEDLRAFVALGAHRVSHGPTLELEEPS